MDYRILIRILSLLLFSINLQAQVFVPVGYWRGYSNCTTDYCPTLNPMNAALQGTGGSTQIVSTCIDDNFIGVTLPWDFHMGDVPFRNFFIGSNTYITAGTGSSLYSGLSASVPAFPKFHLGAGDANYQRVYRTNGGNTWTLLPNYSITGVGTNL